MSVPAHLPGLLGTAVATGTLLLSSLVVGAAASPAGAAGAADVDVPITWAAEPSSLGPIGEPESNHGCDSTPPSSIRDVKFVVDAPAGQLVDVQLDVTLEHPFVGDLIAVLIAPDGITKQYVLWRAGRPPGISCGDDSDLDGTYRFSDSATGDWWEAAAAVDGTTPIDPTRAYRASDFRGNPLPLATPFLGLTSTAGTWTLQLLDVVYMDSGAVTGAELTLSFRDPSPDTEITAGPTLDSRVLPGEQTFEFSSPDSDVVGFECAQRGRPFGPCVSPASSSFDEPGPAAFRVRAVDANSADPTPAVTSFEVRNLPCERATRRVAKWRSEVSEARAQLEEAQESGVRKRIAKARKQLEWTEQQLRDARRAKARSC